MPLSNSEWVTRSNGCSPLLQEGGYPLEIQQSPENYQAIAEKAQRIGIPVEGHVPLSMSRFDVARAGQRSIEHLTLVLEACIPGTLDWVREETSADSLALLADGRLADSLDRFDAALCESLFQVLREAGTWQVPTLVQMRGFFVVSHDAGGTRAVRRRRTVAA